MSNIYTAHLTIKRSLSWISLLGLTFRSLLDELLILTWLATRQSFRLSYPPINHARTHIYSVEDQVIPLAIICYPFVALSGYTPPFLSSWTFFKTYPNFYPTYISSPSCAPSVPCYGVIIIVASYVCILSNLTWKL